jgi:hypothetical protein
MHISIQDIAYLIEEVDGPRKNIFVFMMLLKLSDGFIGAY